MESAVQYRELYVAFENDESLLYESFTTILPDQSFFFLKKKGITWMTNKRKMGRGGGGVFMY